MWFGWAGSLAVLALLTGPAFSAHAPHALLTPSLRLPPATPGITRVALTFDACDGHVDRRILDALEKGSIPATIFVTGKWLARNPDAFAEMHARPDLFEIEDHGAQHLPAVDYPTRVFGLRAAGSPVAVASEVEGGAQAIRAEGGSQPHWFRGATAEYDASAESEIKGLGLDVAGFSLNGDGGATYSAAFAARSVAGAADGDVILAHINQPTRPAGAGVVEGIAALQARGVHFVRLEDAFPLEAMRR